jgi:hypothetical protein
MHRAVIAYRSARIEAYESDDVWTVRLANLEARASYLDLALAELLNDPAGAHRAAARLLTEMEELVDQPPVPNSQFRPAPRRKHRSRTYRGVRAKPLPLAVRVFAFALVASATFMLTTWVSAFR